MNTKSISDQHCSIWASNEDVAPLFLFLEPENIEPLGFASELFLSLVAFVEEGYNLDDEAIKHACTLLENIDKTFSANQKLFGLVPKLDGSDSGFTESVLLLLTSSNAELSKSVLKLLWGTVDHHTPSNWFTFIETQFFTRLPKAFYEQEIHLVSQYELSLMKIVRQFLFCPRPGCARQICQELHLLMDSFQRTFLDDFFHPVEQFLEFICSNRRRIEDSEQSWPFSVLLSSMIECSPFLDQTTQFVLSSSFSLAFTDTIVFFETDRLKSALLWDIYDEDTAVQKRRRQIEANLFEDGLLDEAELLIQSRSLDDLADLIIFDGAQMIYLWGGNVPFFVEVVDWLF
ncbi:hypothetical protein BLNAU_12433 [Blattamonas nauphoetae]|uniref:Uncharacterized protein n=1 Tax=Blattamonas nauphoetae TaxID=2049346 RepID=A0ABQ9XN07_9EUKA|nr:hypothetical protein BLNAU_12433 [Blattamonas nauphoetae]